MIPTAFDRLSAVVAPAATAGLRARLPETVGLFAVTDTPPALLAGLRALAWLRVFALAGQAALIAAALGLSIALPIAPMAAALALLVALALATQRRLERATPASHREIFTHIALDVVAFSVLLACAGGASNPFVLLYLVNVAMMALLLPPRKACAGIALVLAAAAIVGAFAPPLHRVDGSPVPAIVLGAGWALAFALTAAVTAWLVMRVVASLQAHGRDLAEARRVAASDEAVLRIGALAAGAAHELATPLGTMAIVVGEMQRGAQSDDQRRDSGILASQIAACRQTLARLLATADRGTDGGGPVALDALVLNLIERFRTTRPGVGLTWDMDGPRPAPTIFADASLGQALLNLLNNAADASPAAVSVHTRWTADEFTLVVDDSGSGIPDIALPKLGRQFFTTKPPGEGTGLGLLLTRTVIGRLGGAVRWSNRAEGGARAEVSLPLRTLSLQELSP